MRTENMINLGMMIIFLGFVLIILGMAGMSFGQPGGFEGGGIILIGPIPIIFGTSAGAVIILVILAIILMLFAFLLPRFMFPRFIPYEAELIEEQALKNYTHCPRCGTILPRKAKFCMECGFQF